MESEIPIDWGSLVVDDRATDDEMDEDYTTMFWSDNGPNDGPTEEEQP